MTATKFSKQNILEELKKGNMEVLKDLPPVMAMSYGMAMSDAKEESPINYQGLNEAMLNRMKDSGVKEQLIEQIEQEEKDRAVKVALAKQISAEFNANA